MDPVFTEEQLNRMSREDMLSLLEDHAGASSKAGRNAAEAGIKDPDPGRENKGTGIPERNAL